MRRLFVSGFLFLSSICLITSCSDDVIEDKGVFDTNVTRSMSTSSDVTFPMDGNVAYNNMLKAFNGLVYRNLDLDEQSYPDFYGGAYINKDGKLVVNVCEYSDDIKTSLRSMAQNNSIIISSCDYSYNYLLELMNDIRKYKSLNPNSDLTKSFRMVALEEVENRLSVYLSDLSLVNDFKKEISNSPAISFFESDYSEKQAGHTVNPGEGMYVMKNGSTYLSSIGYRVKRNGEVGFVTAGHSVEDAEGNNFFMDFGGTSLYFGEPSYAVTEGAVDAGFVKLIAGFECTNIVGDDELYTVAMTPAVGTVVNLRSFKGHKWGPIKNLFVDVDYQDGDSFKGLMDIEYNEVTVGGESGGVVYAVDSSTGLRFTVGLHEGTSKEGYAHTTKAVEANKKLALTQY